MILIIFFIYAVFLDCWAKKSRFGWLTKRIADWEAHTQHKLAIIFFVTASIIMFAFIDLTKLNLKLFFSSNGKEKST